MALRSFPALLLLAGCLLLVGSSSAVTDHLRKPGASLLSADAEPYLPRKRPELALTLGDLVYGGSGCSEGSATLTTAGPLYTLQFSNYTAAVSTGPRRVRKTCNVFIPVQAPPGIQVAVAGMSMGGVASLPDANSTYGEARAEYFFAGSTGPVLEREFEPGFDSRFSEEGEQWVLTECGGSTNFRISSSVQARNSPGATVSLDTMSFKFVEVECRSSAP
mmetsp:Transcript_3414/g.8608  ORF Transcript_3414/g.8608 Transcript_3414/m.8608 type:complete len:219 (+) Transcript_3414:294-950(+)|eukprot:jgi/Tetstr1/462242/TSEL_000640.t1